MASSKWGTMKASSYSASDEHSLVPRPCPKNRKRGLVAFPCIFCRPLPLKILRSQSDCRMKPRGTWSRHMRMRPKVPTMQYSRVARDGVVCVSYIRTAVVLHVYGRSVDDRNHRALFTHKLTGYPDKHHNRLLALAWVLINWDNLSEFVCIQI